MGFLILRGIYMYIFPKPLDQNNHCFKKILHYDHKKLTVEVCFSYQISLAFYIEVNGQKALFPGASLAIILAPQHSGLTQ